ncbi:hypothetical protein G7Y89_g7229 [Cudoniella acicularis]|uniref:Beta-xylosidase C-terminal Concanavalin A-like domain-containing protein n=1 Tax=Cudoniella acicularis TaxID=354080 RepID=A0A8H4W4S3_9HELO|nr:hypothetical protein G7Y89_g7229 [Cudoniella acicularis]
MRFTTFLLALQGVAFAYSSQALEPKALSRASGTFTNPVLYEDFADNDVFLGPDNKFYFSASNMHYSPGAPILRSSDLVNWEFVGHSVPSLSWSTKYNMTGGETAYRAGTWASTMRYRKSNGLWYWIGCIDFWNSYVYTAPDAAGPWTQRASLNGNCYYDCGLHIDDDDTMYVVHGNTQISMSQLAPDGFSEVKSQQIFVTPPGVSGLEGNRLYKRNGTYYVLDDAPSDGATYIWKASSPWGPWTSKLLQKGVTSPVPGGGVPDQGSLIQTPTGDWYFMSFTWAYPSGRMPILAPITWGSNDFPILSSINGTWGTTYPSPLPIISTPSWTGTENFHGFSLSPQWEWNHNPDTTKFALGNNSLVLSTATITSDLYKARNTLTHRIHGPLPVGTIALDYTSMLDGDRAGLAAFRDHSSYIGIHFLNNTYILSFVNGMAQNSSDWSTLSTGTTLATVDVSDKRKLWLRVSLDARASGSKEAKYFWSADGVGFKQLGGAATLNTDWQYFMGYRFGIFNFATKGLGGQCEGY